MDQSSQNITSEERLKVKYIIANFKTWEKLTNKCSQNILNKLSEIKSNRFISMQSTYTSRYDKVTVYKLFFHKDFVSFTK